MSILSGIGQIPSVLGGSVGQEIIVTSFGGGGNLPSSPTLLVSGTTYTFINTPFPFGTGIYGYNMNFDITGDNTTSFTRIKTQTSENLGGFVISDNDFLIGTTLPDTTTFNFSYLNLVQVSTASNLYITFTPTFTGTAPTIAPSPYIYFYKIANNAN
jgi:hypothetical protein